MISTAQEMDDRLRPTAPRHCTNRHPLRIRAIHGRSVFLILNTALILSLPHLVLAEESHRLYYIAPSGNDSWSGMLPTPNRAGTDGPFVTLERARDAVRESRKAGIPADVQLRKGVYSFKRTLLLDSVDSGTALDPAVWSSAAGEEIRCIGGKTIGGFHQPTDLIALRRIDPQARGHVLVTDLRAQGITDFGTLPSRLNLYYKGARMTVARYPDTGWLTIAGVPFDSSSILNPGDKKVIKSGHPAGRHSGRFLYEGDRPSRWRQQTDIWMHGYWVWDWRDGYQKVERIDTATRSIYPATPHHHYGYEQGQRYYFLNVLEELDAPGEWMLDETSGMLYFWPPAPLHDGDVSVSLLNEPMVRLENTSHVIFRGIIFEGSRASAVKIQGGADNVIAGCTVRDIDNDTSLIIDGGLRNGIRSCDIYDVGATGIRITGGDRYTLTPAGNFATNNHITRYGCIVQAFNGGIFMQGVGNVISHNRIHNAPFSGIQYYGNDHIIEFNDIYDLAHESGDVGGINTGADYSEQGTQIRYNYVHDIHGIGEGGCRAIYLDLPGSNTTIHGNIIVNVDIGVFFNSGRDNVVTNNIFVNCHPSVNIYIWPHKFYYYPGGPWKIAEKLHDIRYKDPPYSTRYPKLPSYLDSINLGMPYGHTVVNNISTGGTWLDMSEGMNFTHVKVERNLIGDSVLFVQTRKWTPDYDPYHIGFAAEHTRSDSAICATLTGLGNVLDQPGFVDASQGDFRLRDDSPAWKLGFERIPVEKIGLFTDEYRKDLGEVRLPSREAAAQEFGRLFNEHGVEGTFLLYDLQTGESTGYRPDRWDSAYIPASTFKVFNALVALETGVIASPQTIIPWDKVKRSVPDWNRDHTLTSGFKVSAVWFYQELARRIGKERMQAYLDSVGYGNRTMGAPIDWFWLGGALRITPRQQVEFLVRLYQNRLPFSERTISLVKEIMIAEQTGDYTLRAKTGRSGDGNPEVGWYVGYVERGKKVFFFATELDVRSDADARQRVELSRALLKYCGIL